jgi:uncharacterized protein YuzE
MRVVYDSEVDILDIYLSPAERHTSRELSPGVIADLDKADNIISLEILDASTRYPSEELAKFSFERTPA